MTDTTPLWFLVLVAAVVYAALLIRLWVLLHAGTTETVTPSRLDALDSREDPTASEGN